MTNTYTQVVLWHKIASGGHPAWEHKTVWLPTKQVSSRKVIKVKKKEWTIGDIYATMKAELVEKYPKDFKVVIPDPT